VDKYIYFCYFLFRIEFGQTFIFFQFNRIHHTKKECMHLYSTTTNTKVRLAEYLPYVLVFNWNHTDHTCLKTGYFAYRVTNM